MRLGEGRRGSFSFRPNYPSNRLFHPDVDQRLFAGFLSPPQPLQALASVDQTPGFGRLQAFAVLDLDDLECQSIFLPNRNRMKFVAIGADGFRLRSVRRVALQSVAGDQSLRCGFNNQFRIPVLDPQRHVASAPRRAPLIVLFPGSGEVRFWRAYCQAKRRKRNQ